MYPAPGLVIFAVPERAPFTTGILAVANPVYTSLPPLKVTAIPVGLAIKTVTAVPT